MTIKNHNLEELKVIYLESMPWLLQFYLHTLQIHCDGHRRGTEIVSSLCLFLADSLHTNPLDMTSDDLISGISYTPSVPHSRPTTFLSILTLPPKSTLQVTVAVVKSFLRYTEHPPDAQRGWDLPPAVIVPLVSNQNRTFDTLNDLAHHSLRDGLPRMYTPVLLVDLATPDFSMPYNVIIFSCSLMAFIFGSVFNLLTRKFVVVHLAEVQ
jgi:GPI-anchor transamidase subunit T